MPTHGVLVGREDLLDVALGDDVAHRGPPVAGHHDAAGEGRRDDRGAVRSQVAGVAAGQPAARARAAGRGDCRGQEVGERGGARPAGTPAGRPPAGSRLGSLAALLDERLHEVLGVGLEHVVDLVEDASTSSSSSSLCAASAAGRLLRPRPRPSDSATAGGSARLRPCGTPRGGLSAEPRSAGPTVPRGFAARPRPGAGLVYRRGRPGRGFSSSVSSAWRRAQTCAGEQNARRQRARAANRSVTSSQASISAPTWPAVPRSGSSAAPAAAPPGRAGRRSPSPRTRPRPVGRTSPSPGRGSRPGCPPAGRAMARSISSSLTSRSIRPLRDRRSYRPLVGSDVGVLQVDRGAAWRVPVQPVAVAVGLHQLQLGHPVELVGQPHRVASRAGRARLLPAGEHVLGRLRVGVARPNRPLDVVAPASSR